MDDIDKRVKALFDPKHGPGGEQGQPTEIIHLTPLEAVALIRAINAMRASGKAFDEILEGLSEGLKAKVAEVQRDKGESRGNGH